MSKRSYRPDERFSLPIENPYENEQRGCLPNGCTVALTLLVALMAIVFFVLESAFPHGLPILPQLLSHVFHP